MGNTLLDKRGGGNVAEEWNLDETMDAAGCTGKEFGVQGRSWKYALGSKSGGNVAEEWNLDERMDAAGHAGKELNIRS